MARIAEARLGRDARERARALLGGAHLADVATWADDEARRRPETGPWHYVNIPAEDGGYDRARHCPGGACAVDRIEAFARVLADRGAPAAERAEALRFLVHFAGDIHQPLHAGRPQDRGGTLVALRGPPGNNLHRAYDDLPDGCGLPRKERAAARALGASLAPAQARAWADSTPGDWATESHLLSLHAYAAVVPGGRGGPSALAPDGGRRCAMARARLAQAGVRLAALIERALR